MPRIFINLEAGCLQVNLMSTSTQINQLKYTILYYINITRYIIFDNGVDSMVLAFNVSMVKMREQIDKKEKGSNRRRKEPVDLKDFLTKIYF